MATLTRAQLYQYGSAAGFSGAALDEVVAIALAESGGNTTHVNVNGASTTKIGSTTTQVPAGTKDRGVLQINDWWNKSVSDACAFDPVCSFQWAFKVTGGRQPTSGSDPFVPYWVTAQTGAYKSHLTKGAGGPATPGGPLSSGGSTAGSGANALGNIAAAPIIDLSPITSWISSLQGLWNWLGNPVRLVKLTVGILMILISVLLLVTPGDTVQEKAKNATNAVVKVGEIL